MRTRYSLTKCLPATRSNSSSTTRTTTAAHQTFLYSPIYGTIYTGSTKKNAEHGGFSFGDTNVGLIVSNPSLTPSVLKTPVATSQVAATILQALGLDPRALKSVQIEKTVKL